MGKYINVIEGTHIGTTANEKITFLVSRGAERIKGEPTIFEEGLVCVVDNGVFAAAGYAYSEREMNEFKRPDGRPRVWLKFPDAKKYAT